MKKNLVLLTTFFIIFTLIGCNNDSNHKQQSSSKAKNTKPVEQSKQSTRSHLSYPESKHRGPNAGQVIQALQASGLHVSNQIDNSHNCEFLRCVSIIQSDQFSLYEWPDSQTAKKNSQHFDYLRGAFTLVFNKKKGETSLLLTPSEQEKYKNALNKIITDK